MTFPKSIGQRIEANRNLAAVAKDAAAIGEIAARLPVLFPPGINEPPSEAKPELWARWPDFQARAQLLERESGNLTAIAESGEPRAVATQFRAVGQTCAGCHETYRTGR